MSKLTLALVLFTVLNFSVNAQCNLALRSVVINEITPDPGNYDGQGAEWTELYNTTSASVDVSNWVLTNGDAIVVIPTGTTIPAHGFLLIYNSNYFNCATCNWDASINELLSTGTGAVPAVNLATCNCTNQSSPKFAIVWDNGGATDRVVLFDCNAQIIDAVYWSNGEAKASAASIIDENAPVYQAATFLESAPYNFAPALNWSIPALTDARWDFLGNDIIGCTTSKSRTTDGANTWIDDNYPSPAQTNTLPDYTIRVIIDDDGIAPFLQTKTLSTTEISAGTVSINICPNQQVKFEVDVYGYNQIYNDLDGDVGNQEGGSPRGGSSISATGGTTLNQVAWSSETITNGITTLSYNFTPIVANTDFSLVVKENTQGPIVNVSSQPGVTSILGTSSANECYIREIAKLKLIYPVTNISYTCNNGLVTVTTTPTNNFGSIQFNLTNGANSSLSQSKTATSTPISFQISSGNAADYSLTATFVGGNGCSSLPSVSGGAFCVFSPPCPSNLANQACANDPSGSKCPGDVIDLGINGANLPAGGTIEWVHLANATDDPYLAPSSDVVSSVGIGGTSNWFFTNFTTTTDGKSIQRAGNGGGTWTNGSSGSTNTPGAGNAGGNYTGTTIKINEVLVDGPTNCDGGLITSGATGPGEYIEIAAPPGTDIGCFMLTDGDYTITIPAGTVVPNDGYYLIGNGNASCSPSNLDLNVATCASCFTNPLAPNDFTFTNPASGSGEYIGIFDPNAILIDGVVWGTPASTNQNSPCAGTRTMTRLGGASGCSALTLPIPQPATCANTTPNCTSFTIPSEACNQTWHIRPRVLPVSASCGATPPSVTALSYDVTCPSATISGGGNICPGNTTSLQIDFANFGGNPPTVASPYIVIYKRNGVEQPSINATSNPLIINNLSLAGIYELASVSDGAGPLCTFTISGSAVITSEPIASVPTITSPSVSPNGVCAQGQVALKLATLTPETANVRWFEDIGKTTLLAQTNPIIYTPPTPNTSKTFYIEAINPDNGCKSAANSVTLTVGNCIFPVELLSFEGELVENKVHLFWQTASEKNSNYFVVEKSKKGDNFEPFTQIAASGTSQTPISYQTNDNQPYINENYYRLKMVDIDGSYNYSSVILIDFEPLIDQMTVSPNPTNGLLQMSYKSAYNKNSNLYIYDNQGKAMRNLSIPLHQGINSIELNLSDLPSGIYFYRLEDGQHYPSGKIIKE